MLGTIVLTSSFRVSLLFFRWVVVLSPVLSFFHKLVLKLWESAVLPCAVILGGMIRSAVSLCAQLGGALVGLVSTIAGTAGSIAVPVVRLVASLIAAASTATLAAVSALVTLVGSVFSSLFRSR